jgi:hypothetical protein
MPKKLTDEIINPSHSAAAPNRMNQDDISRLYLWGHVDMIRLIGPV